MPEYKKELCSFCCLGYQHVKFLKECIESIWNQDYKNIEIIVVDDGSNDGSVEELQKLQEISPCPFILVAQENTGNVALNFNRACAKASGEYITYISLDDIFLPTAISEKMSLMKTDPQIVFVSNSKYMSKNHNKPPGNIILASANSDSLVDPTVHDLLELEFHDAGSFPLQGTTFRRDTVDAIGGYDENMTGDDIIIRTKILRWLQEHPENSFHIIREPAFIYRLHATNLNKNSPYLVKIMSEYYEKFWPGRETPELLVRWVCQSLKQEKFEKYIEIFTYNKLAASLLLNKRVQVTLLHSIFRQKWPSLFFRMDYGGNRQKIVLFNFIKIPYRRSQ